MTGTAIYYFIEHLLAEGTWTQLSGPIYSDSDARMSLAHTRERNPNTTFRLIKRTITDQVIEP